MSEIEKDLQSLNEVIVGSSSPAVAKLLARLKRDGRVVVWEGDEIEDRIGWRAVVSPSRPDSVFLYNKHIACYQLVRHETPSVVKGEVKGDVR